MLVSSLLTTLLAASAATAGPVHLARRGYAPKETQEVPKGWIQQAPSHPDQMLRLHLALKQARFDDLESHLLSISDPESPLYGEHLTPQQVAAFTRPHKQTLDSVHAWLAEHDVQDLSYSPAQDWITIHVPVSKANYMLDTDFQSFTESKSGQGVHRVTSWSLPVHLHDMIDTIQPTTYFSGLNAMRATNKPLFENAADGKSALANSFLSNYNGPKDPYTLQFYCNQTVSVDCIRELYQTSNYTATREDNKLGITGYLEEDANREDLKIFLDAQRPEAEANFEQILINGGENPQEQTEFTSSGTLEAALDIQFGTGIAWPTQNIFYSTAGRPPSTIEPNDSEPYLDWIQAVLKMDQSKIPNVISTSYGEQEYSVPEYYARRVCGLFAELASRGTTLVFSSGDNGVADNDNECPGPNNSTRFAPAFPAACPYVTTVGGTQNVPNEVAVTRFGSGGGFSDYWAMPDWQKSAVMGYLEEKGNQTLLDSYRSDNVFNTSGRAYPDVAALGDRFSVYNPSAYFARNQNSSGWGLIGGTSASAPTFAAVLSQLVDYRLVNGKKSFGWFNPLLYKKLSSGFKDITQGSSFGCDTEGFPAASGWDPVTGFGTPLFKKLTELV